MSLLSSDGSMSPFWVLNVPLALHYIPLVP